MYEETPVCPGLHRFELHYPFEMIWYRVLRLPGPQGGPGVRNQQILCAGQPQRRLLGWLCYAQSYQINNTRLDMGLRISRARYDLHVRRNPGYDALLIPMTMPLPTFVTGTVAGTIAVRSTTCTPASSP
jgi:hypothetical protein